MYPAIWASFPVAPCSSTTLVSIRFSSLSIAGVTMRVRFVWLRTCPPTRSVRCGCISTPPFAIAAYAEAIWIEVTAIPWPIGRLPIVVPDHWSG